MLLVWNLPSPSCVKIQLQKHFLRKVVGASGYHWKIIPVLCHLSESDVTLHLGHDEYQILLSPGRQGAGPFSLGLLTPLQNYFLQCKRNPPPQSPPHTPAPHPCPYGIAFYKIYGVHFLHWLSPCCWSQILIARHTHLAFPNSSSKICFCFRCVRIFVCF